MNSKKVSEFNKLISNDKILEFLKSESFTKPTDVQYECIPALLGQKNVSIRGKTGSGKTLGYLLPLIQMLKEGENPDKEGESASPKAVILLPTRELAMQVFGIAKSVSHFAKLRIRKLVGGDKGRSLSSLYQSQIDVLITTPDRCLRSFENEELKKDNLKYFILDEADQLLEPSFEKTVGRIAQIFNSPKLRVALVSASWPANFNKSIETFFPEKEFMPIGKGQENVLNHKVKTYNISVEEADKFSYAKSFVRDQRKKNGLIFMGNKARAKKIFEQMKEAKLEKLFLLHKDLDVKDRIKVVEDFRRKGGVLIATDIFARGMDVNHLEWVLNFDLPSEPDYYLHRSGRVGRAGRSGEVFNFVTSRDNKRQTNINESLIVQGRNDLRIKHKLGKAKPTQKAQKPKRR
jgi:superfamily II DNA/RNA helicase